MREKRFQKPNLVQLNSNRDENVIFPLYRVVNHIIEWYRYKGNVNVNWYL